MISVNGVQIDIADTFFRRFLGLMGRSILAENQALLIVPCSEVHTAFMRFSIDVVFIDRSGRIMKIIPGLAPWRVALARKAYACLELKSGVAQQLGLKTGQFLLHGQNQHSLATT